MAPASAARRVRLRYKDFKTGLARSADGKHVQSSEICRIFGDLGEARANSQELAKLHWTVVCVVYDHTGAEIQRISNHKEVGKYAAFAYMGTAFWESLYAFGGMSVLWLAYRIALLVMRYWRPGVEPIRTLTWFGWVAFAIAGLMVAITGWFLRVRYRAAKRVRKMKSSFTREEMKRFEEINTLHGTADPVERERLLQLMKEYQQRVSEAIKK